VGRVEASAEKRKKQKHQKSAAFRLRSSLLTSTNYFVVSEPVLMSQVDEILSTVVAANTPPAWLPPIELAG
jgi:hypothetical protein